MLKESISIGEKPMRRHVSDAMKICDFLWISSMLPYDPETGKSAGDDIESQTRQCLENIRTILAKCNLGLDYVLKVTVYLTDLKDFETFDAVYGEYFAEPYPARSVVQAAGLLGGAKIQMECEIMDSRSMEILCSQECDDECCCCK